MAYVEPLSQVPPGSMEGVYKGFTYRVKGDGAVQSIAPDGKTFMHLHAINAKYWIDELTAAVPANCTLDSLAPPSAEVGSSSFMLMMTGTGFTPDAALVWNDAPDTLTYVSDTELHTQVDMSLVTVPSTATVAVYQKGYTTPPLAFEFTAPA